MDPRRPEKTSADYLVLSLSPALIMLLVGSLTFFLILVFYRGEAVDSVRWVLFWFVIAVVLVSRIGIEQGPGHAMVYGLALAAATWLYLTRVHPAYLLGAFLLALVWWCANKLTRDCTLIDEEQDASGHGLLEGRQMGDGRWQIEVPAAPEGKTSGGRGKKARRAGVRDKEKVRLAAPHAPGKWVVYFSVAALPLFGIGQMLLPAGDADARWNGFALLFVYMAAATGLLLTTSFLGLRRYLRQRHLRMPGMIAFGWIRFGVSVGVAVLLIALLLPRPGAGETWKDLRYHIDAQLRRASEIALRLNPPGQGEGKPGNQTEPGGHDQPGAGAGTGSAPNGEQPGHDPNGAASHPGDSGPGASSPAASTPSARDPAEAWYRAFRILLLLAVAALFVWWLVRYYRLLLQIVRSFLEAVAGFFRNLSGLRPTFRRRAQNPAGPAPSKPNPFASYVNPFVTGKDRTWPPEQLILYSYEAIRTWAAERGTAAQPQQTAREFCLVLGEKFPELSPELDRLSFLYGHAAYGMKVPEPCDLEPVKQLWRYVSAAPL